MPSNVRLDIRAAEIPGTIDAYLRLTGGNDRGNAERVSAWIAALAAGVKGGAFIKLVTGAVKATGTITFTGDPSNDETLTINGVTFTAKTSGASGNEFNIGASVTAHATNLAAAINASSTAKILGVIRASSSAGVVTVECIVPGLVGNVCTLTESMANTTVSGANLTGGAEGTDKDINLGLTEND